jgi:DNA-binding response OmpR family regulator
MGNKAYILESDEVFCGVIKQELEDSGFDVSICNQFLDVKSCQIISERSLAVINLSLFEKNINEKIEIIENYYGLSLIVIADHSEVDFEKIMTKNAIILTKPVNIQREFNKAIKELFPKKLI